MWFTLFKGPQIPACCSRWYSLHGHVLSERVSKAYGHVSSRGIFGACGVIILRRAFLRGPRDVQKPQYTPVQQPYRYEFKEEIVPGAKLYSIRYEQGPDAHDMSWREVINKWKNDPVFCTKFSETLAKAGTEAIFWETNPCSSATLDNSFKMALVDAPGLNGIEADMSPFQEHLEGEDTSIVTFPNLGGDAMLVVPFPLRHPHSAYAHMETFVKGAPEEQQKDLWKTLGETLESRLEAVSPRPVWVSTCGLAVYWLHVRLDSSPKYYQYRPFKKKPTSGPEEH